MKTKSCLLIFIFLTTFSQEIIAQSLSKKVQESVVDIGETFTQISKERLFVLDQVAFKLFKKYDKKQPLNVYFIDKTNAEKSQLAMIWLRTGLIYYSLTDILNVHSAGITDSSKDVNLKMLKQYNFKIKAKKTLSVKFGSGSWEVFSKTIESLKPNIEDEKIYLSKGLLLSKNKNSIELFFLNTDEIAREMLYVATRLNNLFQTKQ